MHCLITQNLILSLVHQPHQRSKISLLLWSRKLHTFLDLDMVIQPTTVPIPVQTTCTDMIATLERKWDTINTCTYQRTLSAQLTVVGSKLYVVLGPYKKIRPYQEILINWNPKRRGSCMDMGHKLEKGAVWYALWLCFLETKNNRN